MNRLLLQEGGEMLADFVQVLEGQTPQADPSHVTGMTTIGLASRNEGVTTAGSGLKSSLPIIEHEVMEQVAQKLSLQRVNLNGKEGVTLELSPKELGALKIEIAIHKGSVTAEIFTQYPIVKEILEKNLSALHDGLMQSGFNVDQFSVNVGDFRNPSDSQSNREPFHFSSVSDSSTVPVLVASAERAKRSSISIESGVSLYI